MKDIYFQYLLAFLLLFCLSSSPAAEIPEQYSRIRIFVQAAEDLERILRAGVDLDHYQGGVGSSIQVVLSRSQIDLLARTGIPFMIEIENMDEYHASRSPLTETEWQRGQEILKLNGITGFGYGSMGGFHTYAEVVQKLDSMRIQYPNLVSAKESLGVTNEGRVIWGVEISNNPGVPTPGVGVAYYDALHHAREPISMSVLLYYMYWLLDNYGTNPEATYLVDNRKMFFVPVVNPDGYVYNQTTNPNGQGNWRKNRSNNFDGSRGVDLNRNYGFQWGYDDVGSSPTPSSETYRGPNAWSEPEARAVKKITERVRPAVAFSTHSVAGRYLNPYGYKDTVVAYDYYAEFANDFAAQNNYLYGTVYQILTYNSNGTTRDFLHKDLNCFTWTPEIGGSGFWPAQSEIIPLVQENLLACKYLSWVSGAFADYQSYSLVGKQYALKNDTLRFAITVRNKGLTLPAKSVQVNVESMHGQVFPIHTSILYDSIGSRQARMNTLEPFAFRVGSGAQYLDEMKFVSTISQEGVVTSIDTFFIIIGFPKILFSDGGESGIGNWTRSGNGVQWDTASVMAYTGNVSIADSRYGNVANSTTNYLLLTNQISLVGSSNPRLEYFTRWSNEGTTDYVRVQVSTNNGTSWTNLNGRHSILISSQPGYSRNKGPWAWESINLNSHIGQHIKIRFNLVTNSSVRGDGLYLDDLRIVDYRDSVLTSVVFSEELPVEYSLDQNFPNPFNPVTDIGFSLPSESETKLMVYDLLGREVATLVNEKLKRGSYKVSFDASRFTSGVYFYRLETKEFVSTKKLVYSK